MSGIMEYANITGKATVFPISLFFTRIVQIHQQGTKRRMRFLWLGRFLSAWRGKDTKKTGNARGEESFFHQNACGMGKCVYFCSTRTRQASL